MRTLVQERSAPVPFGVLVLETGAAISLHGLNVSWVEASVPPYARSHPNSAMTTKFEFSFLPDCFLCPAVSQRLVHCEFPVRLHDRA